MRPDDAGAEHLLFTPEELEAMAEQGRRMDADDAAFAGRANRRFLSLCPDAHRRWPGVAWVNPPEMTRHDMFGLGAGFGALRAAPEPPRFRTSSRRKAADLPGLCFYGGTDWLLASERCAEALARLQPGGVDVLPVEVQLRDGTVLPAGRFAMVDVMLRVAAYDLAASGLEVEEDEYGRRYVPRGVRRVILRDGAVAGLHLFRDEVSRIPIWASVDVRAALRRAKVTSVLYSWPDRLDGIAFHN